MTPENISKKIKNYRYTKRALYSGSFFKNGADSGTLLELFNKTLQPVLSSSHTIILYLEIENYLNGVEN